MNNKEFILELSQRTGMSQQNTKKMVFTVMDHMLSHITEETPVHVPNFGSFEVKKRLERVIVNPDGRRMLVPPKLVINFRPTTGYKEQLNNGGGQDE